MQFASNNPFRPRATDMMPTQSAPSPFSSNNPFLDSSSTHSSGGVSPGGLPASRRASEDLPSLLLELGLEEDERAKYPRSSSVNSGNASNINNTNRYSRSGSRPAPPPPPPPPPRSSARRVSDTDTDRDPFAEHSSSSRGSSHRHAASAAAAVPVKHPRSSSKHRGEPNRSGSASHHQHSHNHNDHHRGHSKSGSPSSRQKHQQHRKSSSKQKGPLDTIDRLDVTGIFGAGFHHDGPFDACNPHRNLVDRKAPMLAFPADSENNSLGAPAHLLVHRKGLSASAAISVDGIKEDPSGRFDVTYRPDPVFGETSLGLGSTTFFEGTPASRAAIEQQQRGVVGHDVVDFSKVESSLVRKKSIVQKLRSSDSKHQRHLTPINTAQANTNAGSRHHSADERPLAILEEDCSGMPPPAAPRMIRQVSSPASSSYAGGDAPVPSTLLKRVRSLKVGSSKRKE
ncbi:Pal1 cell morphology protein-domain-containing protein [Kockiozyma suomiensis]|uniref:Pal1 cell morphology protein-domain-containing protein n=1 Tax=Kockiozyma suomiensis TaxID=1337062 RepID=UPI00334364D6